jgi:hypothetical protein
VPESKAAVTIKPWMRSAGFVVCTLVMACRASPEVGDLRLVGGTTLRELLSDSDTTVVLLANPSDCFSCSATVGEWAARRAAGEVRVSLILTREPTAAERRQFAAFRLPVAGVLARSALRRRFRSTEYLFVGGVAVMADTLRKGRYSSEIIKWARARHRRSQ